MVRTYHTFDVIVIGGGTAGLSAFEEASEHTDNILLIHDGPLGTTCARTGCMPSKSFVHAAKLYHDRLRMKDAGIKGTEHLEPDIPSILNIVRQKRHHFVSGVRDWVKKYEPHILHGKARLESTTKIRVSGRLLHAKSIIIATGSSPHIPDVYKEFSDKIVTTDSLFELKDLPARMAVIGLGPVGLELAQALARLGIDVTAITKDQDIGSIADNDIANKVLSVLKEDMNVWMGAKPGISRTGEALQIEVGKKTAEVDLILMATGRKPNLASLGLKRLGVPMDGEGVPHFNRHTMQVPGFPLYLAGDATDERAILHEAADEGKRAAYHAIMGEKQYNKRKVPLSIIFTHPNIAVIGDSGYAMRRNGVLIGEASFEDQGRAKLENQNKGKIRIAADEQDGTLRSCELMAPEGEHLAHLMAMAMEQRLTAAEMLEMPFYHPTLEEALRTALNQIEQQRKKMTLFASNN